MGLKGEGKGLRQVEVKLCMLSCVINSHTDVKEWKRGRNYKMGENPEGKRAIWAGSISQEKNMCCSSGGGG